LIGSGKSLRRGTTHIQQAVDGLRLAGFGANVNNFNSHAFFTTASLRKMGLGSRADIAALALAISFGDFGECLFV
jgi:hypothetical protein